MKIHPLLPIVLVTFSLVSCSTRREQTLTANKSVVLRSEAELWSKGDLAVADELYSTDFVCHFVGGQEWRGLPGIKGAVASHRTSFPDWNERVDDIMAEGDKVALRITSTGTQRGGFMGLPPSGKKVSIQEFHIFRVANGKIVEQWGMPDVQGLMAQLDVSPANRQSAH